MVADTTEEEEQKVADAPRKQEAGTVAPAPVVGAMAAGTRKLAAADTALAGTVPEPAAHTHRASREQGSVVPVVVGIAGDLGSVLPAQDTVVRTVIGPEA